MTAKKTYRIPLTKKQQKKVLKVYQAECLLAGVEIGVLVGQPTHRWDRNQPLEDRGMLVISFFTEAEARGMMAGYRKAAGEESQPTAEAEE